MSQLFANNASTSLLSAVSASDSTITVAGGDGTLFPEPTSPDFFLVTCITSAGDVEVMRCTARSGDVMTVERGREGTTIQSFSGGDRVELRVTTGTLEGFLQKVGGAMEGPLDMGNFDIDNVNGLTGETRFEVLFGGILQAADKGSGNQFVIPEGGGDPTLGGSTILTAALMRNAIFMYTGDSNAIPAPFVLCDGDNGTPDLRDKFIVGAGSAYASGNTGGKQSQTTSSNGAHDHGSVTGNTTLTLGQIPAHGHPTRVSTLTQATAKSSLGGGMVLYDQTVANYPAHTSAVPANPAGDQIGEAGGDGPHNHGIDTDGAHTHTFDNRPPYYALAFIMIDPNVA